MTLLISQIGNMSSAFVDARQAVAAAAGIQETEVEVVRFHPESFLIRCPNQMVRDHLVAASPIPLGHTNMSLQPWTLLAHSEELTAFSKIKLELVGIPPHAWDLDMVSKFLASYCWVERIEPATTGKTDLLQFILHSWTLDPFAIPESKKLLVAEREVPVVHADPEVKLTFGNLPPFLRRKRFLAYPVDIHLRSIADFAPRTPSTSGPSSPSVDGDSGPDGNPDRAYGFREGTAGPRLMGFHRRDHGGAAGRAACGGAVGEKIKRSQGGLHFPPALSQQCGQGRCPAASRRKAKLLS